MSQPSANNSSPPQPDSAGSRTKVISLLDLSQADKHKGEPLISLGHNWYLVQNSRTLPGHYDTILPSTPGFNRVKAEIDKITDLLPRSRRYGQAPQFSLTAFVYEPTSDKDARHPAIVLTINDLDQLSMGVPRTESVVHVYVEDNAGIRLLSQTDTIFV